MPDLPTGTVTFLFTDIEGSTALWERDRAAMRAAVARQLAILQSLIAAHHGVLYKTVGDGTQAAFASAEEALRATLASQRALLAEDWGEPLGPLRVRMALHAGEAAPDDRGEYLAAPLNRLSRLLSTGSGGQILLSQTVQQLTRGALPAGTELHDLGEHRLHDLLEPEHVFQLVHPDLPTDFPPLLSLEARRQNLPRQPTPFLGREQQVADVVELLRRADTQLLTLVGPGGTGKTRLALQAAAEVLEDFAEGVFFVPLAPLTDPALVPSAIATALGLREEGEQSLAERLHNFLATREMLLVLDNFEHLVDGASAVWSLLESAPRLKVLVTSRVPLHLRAEREYPVPPLGLPRRKPPPTAEQLSQYEAVRLFIDRAQAVTPDFAIDNDNAPAVAEICWRLDGLPLAIELAAARVRLLPPQAMLARLEHRLPFLTGGARDAPARQRTLRNTIAWSYDLLEPDEQTLFRRLAVFAGGCTLEAAEAVGNYDGALDALGGVERLCEQSLLRQDEGLRSEPRFVMLETIREFGLERLAESGEEATLRDQHAGVFQVLGEDGHRDFAVRPALRVARLLDEAGNLRTALTWADHQDDGERGLALATALAYLAMQQGGLAEARHWLSRFLTDAADPSPLRAAAFFCAAFVARFLGDPTAALAYANTSEETARTAHSDLDVGFARLMQGRVLMDRGERDEAAMRFADAVATGERLLSTEGPVAALQVAQAQNGLGILASMHGDRDAAARHFEAALKVAEVGNIDRSHTGLLLMNLAGIERERGQGARATTLLAEALPLLWEGRDFRLVAGGLEEVAYIASATGQHYRVTRLLSAAQALAQHMGFVDEPHQVADRKRFTAAAQDVLGPTAFTEAWADGQGLPVEAAVSDARVLLDELARDVDSTSRLKSVATTS